MKTEILIEDRQLGWQTVNEVKKNTSGSKLKAARKEVRLQKEKEQFKNLPGNLPEISDHCELDIKLNLALFATVVHAESLLHSLEQAARGIGLYMNSDKTEFVCFKQMELSPRQHR